MLVNPFSLNKPFLIESKPFLYVRTIFTFFILFHFAFAVAVMGHCIERFAIALSLAKIDVLIISLNQSSHFTLFSFTVFNVHKYCFFVQKKIIPFFIVNTIRQFFLFTYLNEGNTRIGFIFSNFGNC